MSIFSIPSVPYQNFYDQALSRDKSQSENTKLRAEAEYAPYTAYANALSKSTYGKYSPANALATFMNSPAINNLSKEQIEALNNQMQNYLKQASASNSIPEPRGSGNIFDNALRGLIQKISPYSQNAMTQQPQQQNIPTPQAPIPSVGNNNVQPSNASPVVPPQQGVLGGIIPANQLTGTGSFGRQAANASIPGSVGGINPNSGSKATAAGLETGVTAEAKNEVDRMDKMISADNMAAESVPTTQITLDKAKDARGRLEALQKGNIGGRLPSFSTAANDYDAAMTTLVTQFAKADSQGNLTNMGRQLALDAKSPRRVSDESFNKMYEYTSGLSDRTLEKPVFNSTFKNLGYNSTQIPILWNYYQTKKPFYNSDTHKKDEDNINSWEDFYKNPMNVKAAFSPQAQKEINKMMGKENKNIKGEKNKSTKTTQYVTLGDTKYHYVNGEYYQ